jgi:UDP-glucose 4-epimerase
MAKTILISGGVGFVGRHLLKGLFLDDPSANIWIVDDFSTGRPPEQWELFRGTEVKDLGWGKQYKLDGIDAEPFTLIRANFAAVLGAEMGYFPSTGLPALPSFDEVYHLASIVGGRLTIEHKPLLVGMDLAIDSLFFLWAASLGKAQKIMYASSSAAYPVNLQQSDEFVYLKEDMIDFDNGVLAPDLTYGWSKLTGEYLSQIAVRKHKMSVGIVRPFSGYGEDQDPSYPVPAIALRAASKQNPVRVWGTGMQGRDFVHIEDCVAGVISTCRHIHDGSAVNLGSGVLTSFLELAQLMVRLAGYDGDVKGTHDARPVGVAKRVSGGDAAERLLGWKPKISLEEGMGRVVRHAGVRLQNGYQPEV